MYGLGLRGCAGDTAFLQLALPMLLTESYRWPSHDVMYQAEHTGETAVGPDFAANVPCMRVQLLAKDVHKARTAKLQEDDSNPGQACLLTCTDRPCFPAQNHPFYQICCIEERMTALPCTS